MGAGVVVLREGFEASLVVGIVLAFLNRIGRRDGFAAVWIGVGSALALSLVVGVALFAAGAELEGSSEAVFEGTVMLVAAGLLTWMIFWMRNRARTLRSELEVGRDGHIVRLAEHDGDLLHWFYDQGCVPGTELEVREVQPAAEQLTVRVNGDERPISEKAAAGLFVRTM